MSIVRDGANTVAQIDTSTKFDGAGNHFGQTSHPPSIHNADSSSSAESEDETSEARRRRKEKMKAKIEKKAEKLMRK
jgi:hypothetical protein